MMAEITFHTEDGTTTTLIDHNRVDEVIGENLPYLGDDDAIEVHYEAGNHYAVTVAELRAS